MDTMRQLIAKLEYYPVYEIRDIDYYHGLEYSGSPVECDVPQNIIYAYDKMIEQFNEMQRVLGELYRNHCF